MKENPSYYAIIPANVRYDRELNANAKLLYGEITALCNKHGYCWASNNYFAILYGVSKKSVSSWISLLVNKNYLHLNIKYKDGSKEILHRYIQILPHPIEENFHTPIEENFQDNITRKNITSINNKEIYKEKKIFQKPSLEEIKQYCLERKNNVDYTRFFENYEIDNWYYINKYGKRIKVSNWKQKILQWENNSSNNTQNNSNLTSFKKNDITQRRDESFNKMMHNASENIKAENDPKHESQMLEEITRMLGTK